MPRKEGASVAVPMKSVYRMVHQADRPDGAVAWGCPRCGRYAVCHPRGRVVVLTSEADSVHFLGDGFPPAPDDIHIPSEFDQQWLRTHQMVW